jgi:dephospho-CoA kinase
MLKVGLTGGIACGKSIIADNFINLGAEVYDADLISKELTLYPNQGFKEILSVFGPDFLSTDKQIDKEKLKKHIFNRPDERRRLENILHPKVFAELQKKTRDAKASYCIIVVPLLFETNFIELTDKVIVANCSSDMQLERLLKRDKISRGLAIKIIDSQVTESERIQKADIVINTDQEIAIIRQKINELHQIFSKPRKV